MQHRTLLALCLALALPLAGCSEPPAPTGDGGFVDSDGDSIADEHERTGFFDLDTDADGTPDHLDGDSDDDGIPDSFEAGDDDPSTPPVDSDLDGVPDVRDLDADGNGLPDEREGLGDADGDGALDFADVDDDGDGLDDAAEIVDPDFPTDADADGRPDFRDPDSDGDTILDGHEGFSDVDGDGTPDRFDEDSDDDGVGDADEAGDEDLWSIPVDSDEDGVADFRDRDSDGDGLPDGTEVEEGTDPRVADSDSDGVSDLIEVGAETDPLDDSISPRTRGDFVFVVPFREAAQPPRDTLAFRTNIAYADVYFLFDTTGSMSGEIDAMRAAVQGIVESLTCTDLGTLCTADAQCGAGAACGPTGTCITDPRTTGCIASLWTGVGGYGGSTDTYRNFLSLQPDPAETRRRLPGVGAAGGGGDEAVFQSVACVGDPTVCRNADCDLGGIGCPAYRRDALRTLVLIGDEKNGCTTCGITANGAGARLRAEDLVLLSIDADAAATPRDDFYALARASGSLDAAGQPYYVNATEGAVVDAVADSIRQLVDGYPQFVAIDAADLPFDDGDALQFLDHLEVNTSGTGACTAVASTSDTDLDGHADAFSGVPSGVSVCWDVVVRDNDRVRAYDRPLVFHAQLTVRGDASVLDRRVIYFLVPPIIEPPIFG